MFILNKKAGVIQECNNNDVIKVCKKDTEHYAVAETKEELTATAKEQHGENIAVSESNPKSVTGQGEHEEQSGADSLNSGDQQFSVLNAKNVKELRKIAKEKGIQGYENMNKDTLIAIIMNH